MSSPTRYNRSPNGTNIDSQDTFKNNETHAMFSPTCVSMKTLPSSGSSTAAVDSTKTSAPVSKSLFAKPSKRESKKMFDKLLVFQDLFGDDSNTNKEAQEQESVLGTFPLHLPTKTSGGDETKMVLKRQRTSATAPDLPNDLDLPTFEHEPRLRAVRPRLAPMPYSSRKEFIHFKKVERTTLFDPDELNEVVSSSSAATTSTPPCRRGNFSPRKSCLLMLPEIRF